MIRSLRELLGQPKPAVKKINAAPGARAPAARDFRAVSIFAGPSACHAARAMAGKRILMRHAPCLPLADCSKVRECKCRFRRTADRREGERRLEGSALARSYMGTESRKSLNRRGTSR